MKLQFFIITLFQIMMIESKSPHSIVLTFEPLPEYTSINTTLENHKIDDVIDFEKNRLKKTQPKKTKTNISKTITLNGIPVVYYGSLIYSPKNGIIMLPRMHEKTEFYLLIAADKKKSPIDPVFMIKNTIHHFKISPTASYDFFLISKKYDDLTKSYFWHVEKKEIPKDQQLPVETIIIFAHPDDIYLPEGIYLTNQNAQSVLPIIYVKNDTRKNENALALLEINYLFELIEPVKK